MQEVLSNTHRLLEELNEATRMGINGRHFDLQQNWKERGQKPEAEDGERERNQRECDQLRRKVDGGEEDELRN